MERPKSERRGTQGLAINRESLHLLKTLLTSLPGAEIGRATVLSSLCLLSSGYIPPFFPVLFSCCLVLHFAQYFYTFTSGPFISGHKQRDR